jgi:hypothetical protein
MYTIFFAVQRQQRKSDVMTSFGLAACSAVYYHAGSSLENTPRIVVVLTMITYTLVLTLIWNHLAVVVCIQYPVPIFVRVTHIALPVSVYV